MQLRVTHGFRQQRKRSKLTIFKIETQRIKDDRNY